MPKKYFSNVRVSKDCSLALEFRHDVPYKTRVRIAKKIEKKGKRKVTLYSDGWLMVSAK